LDKVSTTITATIVALAIMLYVLPDKRKKAYKGKDTGKAEYD